MNRAGSSEVLSLNQEAEKEAKEESVSLLGHSSHTEPVASVVSSFSGGKGGFSKKQKCCH